ncbi:MAG: carbohydrate ABC transporter permease [Rhizobiales bacterium]|nr:carbohydrate ABC transporter permease [Hyphomicrobiales bacterium]OJX99009.1 MAG: sugar ABC transporter permease [Rhizobiales bacterium 63-22]
MKLHPATLSRTIFTIVGWVVAFILFFPILWTVLTSFKTEVEAISFPPSLIPSWTLANYVEVHQRSDYLLFFRNSVVISIGSTVIGLFLAVPAAWSFAFQPGKSTRPLLMWMLSTKMLPSVGALVPVYLIYKDTGFLDSLSGLTAIILIGHLPLMVWMLYTYFKEIPVDILEAARMDGASAVKELFYILMPMALPGVASTLLLNIILAWNESFWTLNLSASRAAPLSAFIASYSSPQGLFWAKLSAASTLAIIPILILGWISQKQLVRGLTFGAVK